MSADANYYEETDAAWAAGFLDGEGNFALKKRPHGIRLPYITARQINLLPLNKLVEMFGGSIYTIPTTGNQSPCWSWELFGAERVLRATEAIIPFLVLKRPEAVLLRDYAATVGISGKKIDNTFVARRRSQIVDSYMEMRA